MRYIGTDDPIAIALVAAVQQGDLAALKQMLDEDPTLVTVRLGDDASCVNGMSRTLLHVVTDWPGHFAHGPETVRLLVAAGADVNARFVGSHTETPLHWAASCNDVPVLDTLLDCGADIDAPGACIAGGPPLADARAFGQWEAGHRLIQRGAKITLPDAATFGLVDRLEVCLSTSPAPSTDDINRAFWGACHGNQLVAAQILFERGANINWLPPWERVTPLDAAHRSGGSTLGEWLVERGGMPANRLG